MTEERKFWPLFLNRFIEVVYLAIVFLVPLVMSVFLKTNNAFELPKVVLFRSLVYILFFLTLAKGLFFPSGRKFSLKYFVWPLLWLIFGGVSLFFSINPANSYYGLSDRQQGYRSLVFYVWFFFLMVYNLATAFDFKKRLNHLVWAVIISASVSSLYGLLQIMGIDFLYWSEAPAVTHRITSTLGQPNLLGSYLLLVIPFSLLAMFYFTAVWKKILLLLLSIIQILCLIFTSSRAAWLGMLVVFILFCFWLWRKYLKKMSRVIRVRILLAFLGVVVLVGMAFSRSGYLLNRMRTIADIRHGSIGARMYFWEGSWKSFQEKPLLGYGLENQSEEITKYYEPNWATVGTVNATTNRAHNIILDMLLTSGLVGLVLYIGLLVWAFRLVKKNIRQGGESGIWSQAICWGLIGYLISLLFGFEIVTTAVYFWLFLAIIVAVNIVNKEKTVYEGKRDVHPLVSAILLLAVLFSSVLGTGKDLVRLTADYDYRLMCQALNSGDYGRALWRYDLIMEKGWMNSEYRSTFFNSWPWDDAPVVLGELVRGEAKKTLELVKTDTFFDYSVKARAYYMIGDSLKSEEYYDKLVAFNPQIPGGYSSRGQFYAQEKKYDLAVSDFLTALSLLPAPVHDSSQLNDQEVLVGYYINYVDRNLGNIYFAKKDYVTAEKYYRLAYEHKPDDDFSYKRLADTYYLRGDLKTAMLYMKEGMARQPENYIWPQALSALYQERGETKLAKEYSELANSLKK
jgi:O-antigen ligase/tetratricopeptide (TPR) repeat protein